MVDINRIENWIFLDWTMEWGSSQMETIRTKHAHLLVFATWMCG